MCANGSKVGRPVTGDVHQLAFTGHVAPAVPARPLGQRVVVGAVDEDHAQPELGDADPADRLTAVRAKPVQTSFPRDRLPRRRDRDAGPRQPRRVVLGEPVLVALCELVLLPVGVDSGERVLPAPDDQHPGENGYACQDHQGPGDSRYSSHRHASWAFRSLSGSRFLAFLTVSTICRTASRTGPRGGRSEALGYGA